MALEQKLSLKLSQKLVMTPSLQQAIKLLQMTRLELEGVLSQELEENPVLEELIGNEDVDERTSDSPEETPKEADTAEDTAEPESTDSMEDIDFEAYFSEYLDGGSTYTSMYEQREAVPLENILSNEPDLYDHLLWQLHMSDHPELAREIAELIIGNLDPDGFLVATLEEIQALGVVEGEGTPFPLEEVESALRLIQSFDPPGVACATLRESLLLQLKIAGEDSESLAIAVVDSYWDLFLRRQFQTIAKELAIELAKLEPVVERIKSLETRPGRSFNSERPLYVEPDVAVIRVGNEYVIQLNDDGMPRLRVSRAYRQMLQKMRAEGRQKEAQQYIREKMRSALWLIKSLDQRQRTIYKVAKSIAVQQQNFLDHGIDQLRPMVLRDVAEDIGMHESTVSRVVSNKYINTPRGLFPMKFFFHSGIDREYGENISSLTVKRKIQQMIDNEDTRKPLSDSVLMNILRREGIHIARRTVAKYRDELRIPSSTGRKKIF